MRALPKTLVVVLSASLLVLLMTGGQAVAAKPKTSVAALKVLAKQANKLPSNAASRAQIAALRRTAANASRLRKRRPCSAAKELSRFRKVLRGVKVKKGKSFRTSMQKLADLGPASLDATSLLLANKRTKSCGGGVKPSTLPEPKSTLLSSDENGLEVRVQLPELRFVPKTGGGQTWTQLQLPDSGPGGGQTGAPGIPVTTSQFGVPDGATLQVDTSKAQTYTVPDVDVFPVQPEPVDDEPPPNFFAGEFKEKPFTIDKAAYKEKEQVPPEPADGSILGSSRDLVLGNLQVPAAQYNPANKTLEVIKSIDVKLTFSGGPKTFSPDINSPWERAQQSLVAQLLNASIFRRPVFEILRRCGEEMLVITSPATRPAADRFATAKRAMGMRTNVFETGAGAGQIGTAAAQIQTFIRGRLTQFLCIHPSYVTIMGDDDLVPTFPGINGIVSDLQYSMRNDADELPDVSVGRIIGNDQTAVDAAVGKIVNYETSPPTGPMLNRATIAAQFQDDDNNGTENRTFIQMAETARNGLVARGVAVDRVYQESPGNNPQKFNDGTDLPAALKKPTFGWNGTGAQVTSAWNEGRFMVVHRDHGWSDGWGHPGYSTADVQGLTNGANLPVVLSINCSSGAYDYDETSFAGESLVKPNGGSVGVFGDTRDSPSVHNTIISLGFIDALLPSVLPAEGPSLRQRTGPALIHGKLRLAGLRPPSGPGITGGDGSTRNELYLWHYFGDPSMQMWGGGVSPFLLDLSQFAAVFERQIQNPPPGDPPPYQVVVQLPADLAGQPISLLRNGDVIGKGTAGNGSVTIFASFGDGSPKPGELAVAVDADGSPPVQIPVNGVPKASTSLSQTCPTFEQYHSNEEIPFSGTLSGAPAGSTVEVEIKTASDPPDPELTRTIVRQLTTNASGQWSTSVQSESFEDGNWQVKASYAGDDKHAASSTGTCTFKVADNS